MPWFAGVKREEINWHPTIDSSKCVRCGMCMNCGKEVFQWGENNKPIVVRPQACVVGCTTCGNLCLGQAISFPSLAELRDFYHEKKVWSAVKKELRLTGKIPTAKKGLTRA